MHVLWKIWEGSNDVNVGSDLWQFGSRNVQGTLRYGQDHRPSPKRSDSPAIATAMHCWATFFILVQVDLKESSLIFFVGYKSQVVLKKLPVSQ